MTQEVEQTTVRIGEVEVSGPSYIIEAISDPNKIPDVALPDDIDNPVIGVGFSRPVYTDLKAAAYDVLAVIGPPHQIPVDKITRLSEDTAVVIDRIRRAIGLTSLKIALSCPVSMAFMLGQLLHKMPECQPLHWDGNYDQLPKYDDGRVQRTKKRFSQKPERV